MKKSTHDLLADTDNNCKEQDEQHTSTAEQFNAAYGIDADDDCPSFFDDPKGPDYEEVPEFNPTREELLQLLRYWADCSLETQYFYFLYGQAGGNRASLADRRISRIADLLSDEEVKKVLDEVYDKFGKDVNPKHWNIFLYGSHEEKAQVQEEAWSSVNDEIRKRAT